MFSNTLLSNIIASTTPSGSGVNTESTSIAELEQAFEFNTSTADLDQAEVSYYSMASLDTQVNRLNDMVAGFHANGGMSKDAAEATQFAYASIFAAHGAAKGIEDFQEEFNTAIVTESFDSEGGRLAQTGWVLEAAEKKSGNVLEWLMGILKALRTAAVQAFKELTSSVERAKVSLGGISTKADEAKGTAKEPKLVSGGWQYFAKDGKAVDPLKVVTSTTVLVSKGVLDKKAVDVAADASEKISQLDPEMTAADIKAAFKTIASDFETGMVDAFGLNDTCTDERGKDLKGRELTAGAWLVYRTGKDADTFGKVEFLTTPRPGRKDKEVEQGAMSPSEISKLATSGVSLAEAIQKESKDTKKADKLSTQVDAAAKKLAADIKALKGEENRAKQKAIKVAMRTLADIEKSVVTVQQDVVSHATQVLKAAGKASAVHLRNIGE